MNPSNINKQVELEDIAGERLRFINRKCKQMGAMNDELLNAQRRAYELMCSGVKFDDPLEQRFGFNFLWLFIRKLKFFQAFEKVNDHEADDLIVLND